jgi:hypothetical protein
MGMTLATREATDTEYTMQHRVCACGQTILHSTNVQCATCLALYGLAGYVHNGYHYVPRYPVPSDPTPLPPYPPAPIAYDEVRPMTRRRTRQTPPQMTIVCVRCAQAALRPQWNALVCGACLADMTARQVRWCPIGQHETPIGPPFRYAACADCRQTLLAFLMAAPQTPHQLAQQMGVARKVIISYLVHWHAMGRIQRVVSYEGERRVATYHCLPCEVS